MNDVEEQIVNKGLAANHLEKVMESDSGLSTNQRLRYAILMDILELGYPYFPWLKMHKGKY